MCPLLKQNNIAYTTVVVLGNENATYDVCHIIIVKSNSAIGIQHNVAKQTKATVSSFSSPNVVEGTNMPFYYIKSSFTIHENGSHYVHIGKHLSMSSWISYNFVEHSNCIYLKADLR